MSQDQKQAQDPATPANVDVIPMNPISPFLYIFGAVLVVAIAYGGIQFSMLNSYDDDEFADEWVEDEGEGASLSKEELKARQEHLKRTQAAVAAVKAKAEKQQAEEAAKKKAAEEEAKQKEAAAKRGPSAHKAASSLGKLGAGIDSALD